MGPRPVGLVRSQAAPSPQRRPRAPLRAIPHCPSGLSIATVRTGYPIPRISPVPTSAEARAITTRMGIAANGQAPGPTMGRITARASPDLGRSGSHQRPRRSPTRWRASAHKDRCLAAQSRPAPAPAGERAPRARLRQQQSHTRRRNGGGLGTWDCQGARARRYWRCARARGHTGWCRHHGRTETCRALRQREGQAWATT